MNDVWRREGMVHAAGDDVITRISRTLVGLFTAILTGPDGLNFHRRLCLYIN